MNFDIFLILTVLTGAILIGCILWAYQKSLDSFHPMIYMGMLLFFMYSYMPIEIYNRDAIGLLKYLSISQLEYIQFINLSGVISICIGVFIGSGKLNRFWVKRQGWYLPPFICKRLKIAAIVCGLIGVIGFAYGIYNAGGIEAAYGKSYGGGWDESGYVRETFLLTLPAVLCFLMSHVYAKLSKPDWAWLLLFLTPLLMQGLLGARRGPTAMALIGITVGLYLMRGKRPQLTIVIVGSLLLGSLLLFLVNNRGEIYLGSDFNFQEKKPDIMTVSSANEYIYGGGIILDADMRSQYLWGRRYFIIYCIRPIPKQLWPTKYDDIAKSLGIDLRDNSGVGTSTMKETLGWQGARGAAPGIIADTWLEFSWFSFLVLLLIGWAYGMAWRKAIYRGGLWIPIYTLMTALSVYLVTQTLEAMAFRFLLTSFATKLTWQYSVGNLNPNLLNAYRTNLNDRNF